MRYCIVRGCPANQTHKLSFFQLPQDVPETWMDVIGRGPEFCRKRTHRICELHFSSQDLKKGKHHLLLRKGAVPSLNPATEDRYNRDPATEDRYSRDPATEDRYNRDTQVPAENQDGRGNQVPTTAVFIKNEIDSDSCEMDVKTDAHDTLGSFDALTPGCDRETTMKLEVLEENTVYLNEEEGEEQDKIKLELDPLDAKYSGQITGFGENYHDIQTNSDCAKSMENENKSFACDQCVYTAERYINLKNHKQSKHEGVTYLCDQCDYIAKDATSVRRHRKSKHLGVRYPCDQCDYLALEKADLRKHKQSKHDGVRYPCNLCEFLATTQSNLKKHKITEHEGVRFSCDKCDYTAKDTTTLKRHIDKTHEGIRYKCDLCDYIATEISNLRRHKSRKHVGCKCFLCEFISADKTILKKHSLSEHNAIIYPCDMCYYVAKRPALLKQHTLRKHSVAGEVPKKVNTRLSHS